MKNCFDDMLDSRCTTDKEKGQAEIEAEMLLRERIKRVGELAKEEIKQAKKIQLELKINP